MNRRRVHIECIVEGTGERFAVPALIRRWLAAKQQWASQCWTWHISSIVTHGCSRLKTGYDPGRKLGIEYYIDIARSKGAHGILVLVDADDDLPCELAPALEARSRVAARGIPVSVAVANREFEAWFIADRWSMRRRGTFQPDHRFHPPLTAEGRRDCKSLVTELLGYPYSAVGHQLWLAEQLSFNRGSRRRSPSFKKLLKRLWFITREARRYAFTHS